MSFDPYLRREAMVVFRWTPEGTCEDRGLLYQRDGTFQTVDGYGNYIGEPMTHKEALALKASIPRERWYRTEREFLY